MFGAFRADPLGNQLLLEVCVHKRQLFFRERKQTVWQRLRAADARLLNAKVTEERVRCAIESRWARFGVVHQKLSNVIDGLWGSPRTKYLMPGMGLDLRKLELRVVRVHCHQFLACW